MRTEISNLREQLATMKNLKNEEFDKMQNEIKNLTAQGNTWKPLFFLNMRLVNSTSFWIVKMKSTSLFYKLAIGKIINLINNYSQ